MKKRKIAICSWLAAALVAVATPAWSAWQYIATTADGTQFYLDPTTIRKDNWGIINVWVLQNKASRGQFGERSARAFQQFDCKGAANKVEDLAFFSEINAGGKQISDEHIDESRWSNIPPGTADAEYLKYLCR